MRRITGMGLDNLDFSLDMHTHPYEKGRTLEAMEAFVLRAIELKLKKIAFTDHAPIDGRLSAPGHAMPEEELDRYYRFCRELKDKYQSAIAIEVGLEADYHPQNIAFIEKLKRKYPFDLLIGSLHLHIPPWADAIEGFSEKNLMDFAIAQSIDLMNIGLFDVIAHFDRFRQIFFKRKWPFDPPALQDAIERLFGAAAKAGIMLEINPHILNTGAGGSLEQFAEMIQWSRKYNLTYTIGSDAHKTNEIASLFPELQKKLYDPA